MKKKYKVVLLGAGFWGKRWIQLLKQNERIEFVGVTCSKGRTEEIKQLSGLEDFQLYEDYREAITESHAEIMINVLPAELHFEADRLAIENGMHVITEKPLVKTIEQAEQLIALLRERPGQLFMASQNYRWRPHIITMKKAVEEDMIGQLESVNFHFRRREDLQGYRKDLEMPLIDDMCIHHFDLMRFFSGSDCESVLSYVYRPSWSQYRGLPSVNSIIHMKNGVEISYSGTWAARGMETSWDGDIVLCGEKGCLTLDADNQVCFYSSNCVKEAVLDTGKQKPIILSNEVMEHEETEYGLFYFIDCLDNGKQPITNLEDNFKSFSMVMACKESALKQQKVEI